MISFIPLATPTRYKVPASKEYPEIAFPKYDERNGPLKRINIKLHGFSQEKMHLLNMSPHEYGDCVANAVRSFRHFQAHSVDISKQDRKGVLLHEHYLPLTPVSITGMPYYNSVDPRSSAFYRVAQSETRSSFDDNTLVPTEPDHFIPRYEGCILQDSDMPNPEDPRSYAVLDTSIKITSEIVQTTQISSGTIRIATDYWWSCDVLWVYNP